MALDNGSSLSENQTEGKYYGRTVKHDAPWQTVQTANDKKMDGIIREYDVKRVEIEILRFLAMSGERNTAADIHRYLDLNKGQISKTLEHLCTMHYLESMPDKKDRRYMHYILSEEAKELVRRINAIWDDMHQQIMSGIQAEDRAIFNKVLKHAMANMERMIDEASV